MTSRLIWAALISAVGAYFVVNLMKALLSSASATVNAVVQPTVFVGAFAAITRALGMRAFSEHIKRLRHHTKGDREQ